MALWLGFIEVDIEWILGFWVKEKDYGDVVLFYRENIEFLSWRVSGIDSEFLALLCGFHNVKYAPYGVTFIIKMLLLCCRTVFLPAFCFGFASAEILNGYEFDILTFYVSYNKNILRIT